MSDLWNLDSLGIKDSEEVQSRKEIEEATKDMFLRSLKKNEESANIWAFEFFLTVVLDICFVQSFKVVLSVLLYE